jgi:hypothetical protein
MTLHSAHVQQRRKTHEKPHFFLMRTEFAVFVTKRHAIQSRNYVSLAYYTTSNVAQTIADRKMHFETVTERAALVSRDGRKSLDAAQWDEINSSTSKSPFQ